MHAFRFAVQVSSAASGQAWAELARRAESLGYDVLVMPDHLDRQLSPLAALGAAAAATTRIRLGAFVFANDYRHPLVLAREAATLDFLSGGRFELGLGAGWMRSDYRALGLTYEPASERVDRLEEAIPIFKRLMSGETVTHDGAHFHLDDATTGMPVVQKPRPPLAIGGGRPRMLRLAAREADIVGITTGFSRRGWPLITRGTESALAEQVGTIREAAGDRFDTLELNLWIGSAGIAGSGNSILRSAVAGVAGAAGAVYGSPYVLYGTLGSLRDLLQKRRDKLGISYYAIPGRAMESMAPLVEAMAGK
jgi:probable F420-dependent oxidoreductase